MSIWWFNIFKLVFTLCRKCKNYNCLPWKILNHSPETVMSHRIHQPPENLFCTPFSSGLRSNDSVSNQSKQRSGILKQYENLTCSVFHIYRLSFCLKMYITIMYMYITCLLGRLYRNVSPWSLLASPFGIGRHNAQGLLCDLGASILVCNPRNHHVIYV